MIRKFLNRLKRKGPGKDEPEESPKSDTRAKRPAAKANAGKQEPNGRKQGSGGDRRKAEGGAREQKPKWSIDSFQVPPKEGEARFHDFDLPVEILHAVQDLGFEYCTPIQRKVLSHAKPRQDIAGRAQTGTGKTAAFLICVIKQVLAEKHTSRKPGTPRALVIAPTRELVIQIDKDAQDLGKYCRFRSVAVYGGMDFQKQAKQLSRPTDMIAATPGRLLDFVSRRIIDLKQLDVLVIDEADRMLDMGFIPDVRRIIRATPPKSRRQTMLFSATLTSAVLDLSSQWMTDPEFCEVDPETVAVDTVEQIAYLVNARGKFKLLLELLGDEKLARVLIFGNRRDSTLRLSKKLIDSGIPCEYLSGSVRQEKRLKILDSFREGKVRVLVATDVVGRGLHVDNITHVINYDFPYEAEDYVHRIGRTGRAGRKGTAISFACEDESFVIPEIEEYMGQEIPCKVL